MKNVAASTHFWCKLCGFTVLYDRPDEGFAYLTLGDAHVMLEQIGAGRNWITGRLRPPLGRGVNFQIAVPSIAPLVESFRAAGWGLFSQPETKSYRTDAGQVGVEQFLVTDPDGYLIRFQAPLADRPTI